MTARSTRSEGDEYPPRVALAPDFGQVPLGIPNATGELRQSIFPGLWLPQL
jgi:hypothetical protein